MLTEARRLVPFVERHKMFVAMHNHNNLVDPDQFATPASFEKALAMSDYFKVTLDIGHFVAGNNDPVDFIRKHHDRIVNIHIRDRKRNNGPSRPFGQGDTPIKEVLRLIRDNQYPIRCYLEDQVRLVPLLGRRGQEMSRGLPAGAGASARRAGRAAAGATSHAQAVPGKPDAGGMPAPTVALERGRTVYVLNTCHFCHGVDLTKATMGAAVLMHSALVGADENGNVIGAIVRAGIPNLQTSMPSYPDLTQQEVEDLAAYIHYLRQLGRHRELTRSARGRRRRRPRVGRTSRPTARAATP